MRRPRRSGGAESAHLLDTSTLIPFDRILIAQAKAERLGLVTNGAPIAKYPIQTIW